MKDGRQRLVLDVRVANARFRDPWRAVLPAAAAWRSLELEGSQPLHLAQTDGRNVFYRIAAPAGVSEFFRFPA
eukprot:11160046-Lingulodinium_polyedra.AAC.1